MEDEILDKYPKSKEAVGIIQSRNAVAAEAKKTLDQRSSETNTPASELLRRGLTLAGKGDHAAAIKLFDEAMSGALVPGTHAEAAFQKGNSLNAQAKFKEAVEA
jgi:hypothetical protein